MNVREAAITLSKCIRLAQLPTGQGVEVVWNRGRTVRARGRRRTVRGESITEIWIKHNNGSEGGNAYFTGPDADQLWGISA